MFEYQCMVYAHVAMCGVDFGAKRARNKKLIVAYGCLATSKADACILCKL